MGDPRRIRKKYTGPGHPWQKSRLDEEKVLKKEYGLKNKKELWKIISKLKQFTNQAKKLIAFRTEQGEKEKDQLINRLAKYGLLSTEAKVEDVLNLNTKDLLERRLQTLVLRKELATTVKQARQFITHEHILINNRKITSPNHVVTLKEEATLEFCPKSNLSKQEEPETKEQKPKKAKEKKTEKTAEKDTEKTEQKEEPKTEKTKKEAEA